MAVKFAPAPKARTPIHKMDIAALARREEIAQAMMSRAQAPAPIQHWSQGAAKMVQGLMGAMRQRGVDKERNALRQQMVDQQSQANDIWSSMIPSSVPSATATPGAANAGSSPPPGAAPNQMPPVDRADAAQLAEMLTSPVADQTANRMAFAPNMPEGAGASLAPTDQDRMNFAGRMPAESIKALPAAQPADNDPPGQWQFNNGKWAFQDGPPQPQPQVGGMATPQQIASRDNTGTLPGPLKDTELQNKPPVGDMPSFLGQRGPASVRYNNPGAQYPGPTSKKYGSDGYDIIGGGHKIARFPDAVSGAAAQFDLLNRKYANRTLADGIREWSGGNHVRSYLNVIQRETGLKPNSFITKEMMQDPKFAVPLAKAMAMHETGKRYPLSDQHWAMAHGRVFGDKTPAAGPQQLPGQPQQVADSSGRIGGGPVMTRQLLRRMLANPHTRAQAQKYISDRIMGGQGGKEPKYGKTIAVYRDENGRKIGLQAADNGTVKRHDLGKFTKDRGVGKVDTGTGWEFYDKSTSERVGGGFRKDLEGVEQGKARGQAVADLPKAKESAFKIFSQVDSILLDPNLERMVGPIQGRLPNWSGGANTWESKVKQIGGSAFLEAFQQLKGGGHITEIEGEKATQAIVRMNEAQNEEDFRRGLLELKEIGRRGLVRAHVEAGIEIDPQYLKPLIQYPGESYFPKHNMPGPQGGPPPQQQAAPQLPPGFKIRRVN